MRATADYRDTPPIGRVVVDNAEAFNRRLSSHPQARLERERGICIIITHFGKGLTHNGEIRPDCRGLQDELSQRNGWFVPVSELLDHLSQGQAPAAHRSAGEISSRQAGIWFSTPALKYLAEFGRSRSIHECCLGPACVVSSAVPPEGAARLATGAVSPSAGTDH